MDIPQSVDPVRIEESIQLLRSAVVSEEIDPLLAVLGALTKAPKDDALREKLTDTFNDLGIMQGAVLTYAPYVGILVSENLFGDD